ncbi:MAG: hypothetical protein QXT19_00330 [Candidatus Woesearchaeota archaeon]
MRENAIGIPKAISLTEIISGAKEAHKNNKTLMSFAEMLWRGIYEQIPYLDYNTEENLAKENDMLAGYTSVKGNPDICLALKDCLVKAGMPDCTATLRLVFPAFWFASKHSVLEPCQRKKNKEYLWAFDRKKHENAKNSYITEFEKHKTYVLSNLQIALDTKQNL